MKYDFAIIGGGTAGWLSAAYLGFHYPNKNICLIESPNIPTIGVGEGTFPTTMNVLKNIGIDPRELITKSNGGLKLGIYYKDFAKDNFWLGATHPSDWERWGGEMTRMVAMSTKMPELSDTAIYACHFVAHDLAALLKEHATKHGVNHISAEVVDSIVVNNQCSSITLDTGDIIESEWFIDCSGFSRLLIKKTDTNFTDYSKELLVDSAVVGPTAYTDKAKEFASYTHLTAREAGWQFKIPTYNRIGNGYVYSSQFISPEAAEQTLKETTGVKDARHLKMVLGYYDDLIVGNIVGVGLSGGFIEPMEATAIHITERTLITFHDMLNDDLTLEEANQFLRNKIRYIKTLILAHYAFSKRPEPFWVAAQKAAFNSDEIQEFFANLKNKKFPTKEDQLDVAYPYCQWNELLKGFGQPHYYPTIDARCKKEIYMATYYADNHLECVEKARLEYQQSILSN